MLSLPLIAAPKPGKDDARNLSGNNPLDGARISNILPSVADDLGIDQTDGVAVTFGAQRFDGADPRASSRATSSSRSATRQIATVLDAEKALSGRQRLWQLSVKRGNRVMQLQVPG